MGPRTVDVLLFVSFSVSLRFILYLWLWIFPLFSPELLPSFKLETLGFAEFVKVLNFPRGRDLSWCCSLATKLRICCLEFLAFDILERRRLTDNSEDCFLGHRL